MDDPSLMLLLSNLLHLHTYLDDSSLLPDAASPPSAAGSLVYSSSAAPLLFFAIASALSYASSTLHRARRGGRLADSPPPPPTRSNPSLLSAPAATAASSFFISPDRLISMDPSARDARFRSLYGVSHPVFDNLLKNLRRLNATASMAPSLSLEHALALALARLSRGVSSRALARSLSLPPHLVSRATHALTRLVATRLYSRYVGFPRVDHLHSIVQSFKDLVALPNVAGAIASSPVRIKRRRRLLHLLDGGASNSRDDPVGEDDDDRVLRSPHRAFPSVLLQVVADHRKVFWDACVLAPGSSDPASHLRDSRLYHRLLSSSDGDKDNSAGVLRDAVINVRGHHVRPYLIGDSSYPLLPFLLTPFSSGLPSSSNGNPAHEAFDAAIATGRASSVEAAIALLKGRWKILRNLNVGLNHVAQTVIACIVLHNMCQIAKEPEDESRYMWRDPPESPQPAKLSESERSLYQIGDNSRQVLADDLYERQQKLSGAR